ncbi:MAG: DUF4340 domain-containing protein [Chloroflexi bacterium]|nr:DUF4340 domain-containing protein [Chloroflexota bacterium]
MSYKTTALLVVLAVVVGGFLYWWLNRPPELGPPGPPQFYGVDFDSINKIKVQYQGKTQEIVRGQGDADWSFTDPSIGQVDLGRVNGIRLLVSGPMSKRMLDSPFQEEARDLKEYGLDPPQISLTVGLDDGTEFDIDIGEKSADGQKHYAKFKDFEPVFLIDYTWGNELARFVTEPPVLKEQKAG